MSDAAEIQMPSPTGALCICTEGEAITRVTWKTGAGTAAKSTPLLKEAVRQLEAYFAGQLKNFDLPLKPAGSAHDLAVWEAMAQIPYGRTMTYGTLAEKSGSIARAVGGACGANPIPIIIPCHRVMAAGDKMGGYSGRGGVTTKIFLLRLEGAMLI